MLTGQPRNAWQESNLMGLEHFVKMLQNTTIKEHNP